MNDSRILACIYAGTHRPKTDGVKHPIFRSMHWTIEAPPFAPQPIPYYTRWRCDACSMEWNEESDRASHSARPNEPAP